MIWSRYAIFMVSLLYINGIFMVFNGIFVVYDWDINGILILILISILLILISILVLTLIKINFNIKIYIFIQWDALLGSWNIL